MYERSRLVEGLPVFLVTILFVYALSVTPGSLFSPVCVCVSVCVCVCVCVCVWVFLGIFKFDYPPISSQEYDFNCLQFFFFFFTASCHPPHITVSFLLSRKFPRVWSWITHSISNRCSFSHKQHFNNKHETFLCSACCSSTCATPPTPLCARLRCTLRGSRASLLVNPNSAQSRSRAGWNRRVPAAGLERRVHYTSRWWGYKPAVWGCARNRSSSLLEHVKSTLNCFFLFFFFFFKHPADQTCLVTECDLFHFLLPTFSSFHSASFQVRYALVRQSRAVRSFPTRFICEEVVCSRCECVSFHSHHHALTPSLLLPFFFFFFPRSPYCSCPGCVGWRAK